MNEITAAEVKTAERARLTQ
jgi:uncharacterized protein YutE (UPF0331/DUF86 family)